MNVQVDADIFAESMIALLEKYKLRILALEAKLEKSQRENQLLLEGTKGQATVARVDSTEDKGEGVRNLLRARLLEKGFSLSTWEREKGYNGVRTMIYRFAGKDKRPWGKQARAIIEALESETGIKICGKKGEVGSEKGKRSTGI